jgi:hypothetical protein
MSQRNDHDPDHDHDHVPAPAPGGLASLAALTAALNNVDMIVGGGAGMPMLQFLSREGGVWAYGQKRTIVEDRSTWAVNPMTFQWGGVCFSDAKKRLGEHLVSISKAKPNLVELPDKGAPWKEEWAVNMKCISGADAGTEVVFKTNTTGGFQMMAEVVEAVRDRLNGGTHDGKVVPIVRPEKDSYQHPQHGRIYTPVLTIVDWMPLDGPAPAPAAPTPTPMSPSTAEQPRRRRVA